MKCRTVIEVRENMYEALHIMKQYLAYDTCLKSYISMYCDALMNHEGPIPGTVFKKILILRHHWVMMIKYAVRYIYHVYFHVIQQDFTLCCDMLFVSFISVLCDWVFCNIIA